ncbi:MAG: hypothetical protein NYU90_08090 [Aigarchaeota archaeon]|nr:hypothetical protein [Candidatus Calditenuis fumarioli]
MSDRGALALILISGLAVRLAVAPFTGHSWDVYVWIKSAELFNAGFWNVYRVSEVPSFPWGFYSYPPVWLLITSAAYALAGGTSGGLERLVLAIKLPIVIADVLVALWVYRIAGLVGVRGRRRTLACAAYALNPLPVFISGVWGMFDPIATLFGLVGIELLIRRHPLAAGVSVGAGAATKLFPGLIVPLGLLWIRKTSGGSWRRDALRLLAGSVTVPLAVSLPYLLVDPQAYLEKLFLHTRNVGQFTYWTLLTPLTGTTAASIASLSLFAAAYALLLRRFSREEGSDHETLVYYSAAVTGAFLATSLKVNVQYLLWFLPLVIPVIALQRRSSWRELATAVVALEGAAMLFLVYTNAVTPFSLDHLGAVAPPAVREESATGLLLVASSLIAGWQLLRIGIALIKPGLDRELIGRFGVSSILLLLATSLVVMPTPNGVVLRCGNERIAVLEGPDSLLNPDGTLEAPLLRRLGSPTSVVIPLSLDYFLLRRERERVEVNEFLLFRLGSRPWSSDDLRETAESLRRMGIRPLVGVFAYKGEVLISYGVQGFSTELLESEFPEALYGDVVDFSREVGSGVRLADLVAEGVARAVREDGFEGVYVMTELYRSDRRVRSNPSVVELLAAIRERLGNGKTLILDGVDAFELDERLLAGAVRYADLVVLRTSPWFRSFRSYRVDNPDIQQIYERVSSIVNIVGKEKLAYALYIGSFSEGWVVPAVQVQTETDAMGRALDSCSLVYVGRFVPYRLSAPAAPPT